MKRKIVVKEEEKDVKKKAVNRFPAFQRNDAFAWRSKTEECLQTHSTPPHLKLCTGEFDSAEESADLSYIVGKDTPSQYRQQHQANDIRSGEQEESSRVGRVEFDTDELSADLSYIAGKDTLSRHLQPQHLEANDNPEGEQEASSRPEPEPALIMDFFAFWVNKPPTYKGVIRKGQVAFAVSMGTKHNFISDDAVHRLQLQIQPTEDYGVRCPAGRVVRSRGICRKIKFWMDGVKLAFNTDFYILPLIGGVDAVLGAAWLSRHHCIIDCSHRDQVLSLLHQGEWVEVKEDGSRTS